MHAQSPKPFSQHTAPISSHEEHGLGRDETRKDDSGMLPTYCRMPVALSIWKVVLSSELIRIYWSARSNTASALRDCK